MKILLTNKMKANILWSSIVAIIGLILTIIGVVWFEINKKNNTTQSPWVYIVMLGGILLLIIGVILAGYFFIQNSS
jgi:uncharacterized membrane protein